MPTGAHAAYLHQCVSVEDSPGVAAVAVLSDGALHLNDTKGSPLSFACLTFASAATKTASLTSSSTDRNSLSSAARSIKTVPLLAMFSVR